MRPYPERLVQLLIMFERLAPLHLTLCIQDAALLGERGRPHTLSNRIDHTTLEFQDDYIALLNADPSCHHLKEVYLDIVGWSLLNSWYLYPDDDRWPEMPTDSPELGFWRAHECLEKLTIMLFPLRLFLEPFVIGGPAWIARQVWTQANIARAALRLTHIFPASLEYLTLLVDPRHQFTRLAPESSEDPLADALLDETNHAYHVEALVGAKQPGR
jgi:hypothetical protein